MAGHSKWANIKHKKARRTAAGKVFTASSKRSPLRRGWAARFWDQPRLRLAVEKAYESNMPKENVERAIKRGSGDLEGVNYEEVRYEGYGIGGARSWWTA
jgi:transcriptional/translational regulatory protein YebC/TACO1